MSKRMSVAFGLLVLMILSASASASSYSYGQVYPSNRHSYGSQYDYRYDYNTQRYHGLVDGYAGTYSQRGNNIFLMPSVSYNRITGYTTNYNSRIVVRDALSYTYYTHPELLAPRYMNNHQRQYRGLWPQNFGYAY